MIRLTVLVVVLTVVVGVYWPVKQVPPVPRPPLPKPQIVINDGIGQWQQCEISSDTHGKIVCTPELAK